MINRQLYRFTRRAPDNASLVLDFERGYARVNGVSASIEKLLSVARPTAGSAYQASGALIDVPAGEARYDRRSRSSGLLIERGLENRQTNNSNPAASESWTVTGATAFFNNTDALDGTFTAGQVLDTQAAGSAAGKLALNAMAIDGAAKWWTFAFPIRVSGNPRVKVFFGITNGASSIGGDTVFNIDNGAVVSTPSGMIARVEQLSGGYLRLIVSLFNSLGAGALVATVSRENDAAQPIFFEFDRATVTTGIQPGTPIKTGAAANTRQPDVAKVAVTGSSWYHQGLGTIMIDATLRGDHDQSQQLLTLAGPAGTGNLIDLSRNYLSGAATITARGLQGGAVTAFVAATGALETPRRIRAALSFVDGSQWRLAVAGTQTDWHGGPYGSGVLALTGTMAAPVNVQELQLGHLEGGSFLDGTIHQVAYMPSVLDAAALSALVA